MPNKEQPRKINYFWVPVLSLALGYCLFPLAMALVKWEIYAHANQTAPIWILLSQHCYMDETDLGPMFVLTSFVITLIAVTGIVYYLADLVVLAKQIAAYEAADKLPSDDG